MKDEKVIQGNRVNYPIFYLDFADGCGEVTAGPEPVPLSPDGDLPESTGLGALTFLPAMMSLICLKSIVSYSSKALAIASTFFLFFSIIFLATAYCSSKIRLTSASTFCCVASEIVLDGMPNVDSF